MIKNHSILLLSTLFIISTSPLYSMNPMANAGSTQGGTSPQAVKKHPPVIPATGASSVTPASSAPSLPALPMPLPTVSAAAPAPSLAPVAAPAHEGISSGANSKLVAERQKVTFSQLIARQSSIFSLPTSLDKKWHGADVVVLNILAGLQKGEVLDCKDTEAQNHLSSAVQAIISNKDIVVAIASAKKLLQVSKEKGLFIDKTQRANLRKFLKTVRKNGNDEFEKVYNSYTTILQESLKNQTACSAEFDELIDSTYELGGDNNLTKQELSFLRGSKSSLSKKQQKEFAEKQTLRMKDGLSDNEEEHPDYVDPERIIKVPASNLYQLKLSKNAAKPAKK